MPVDLGFTLSYDAVLDVENESAGHTMAQV